MSKTMDIATKLIKLNEGCKLEVYTCPAGKPTFGFGTNLEVLDADINNAIEYVNNVNCKESLAIGLLMRRVFDCDVALNIQKWFTDDLTDFQQAIILDLAYNIGVAGVLKFEKMIAAIKQRNYGIAGEEMLLSKYHYQMICYGYKDELADAEDIDTCSALQVIAWYNDLDSDYKQLRSACNALSLQFDKPLGKYKELI
jgi:lysozyme